MSNILEGWSIQRTDDKEITVIAPMANPGAMRLREPSDRRTPLENRLLYALADALLNEQQPFAQPAREWVSLTNEDAQTVIKEVMQKVTGGSNTFTLTGNTVWLAIVESVEVKIREKNATPPAQPIEQQPFGHLHTHQWIMRDGKEICLRCDAVKGGAR